MTHARRLHRCARAFLLALLVPGCLSLGGCGSVSPEAACTSGSESYCAWLSRCIPVSLNVVWGDTATCVARLKLSCMDQFLTGSNAKSDDIVACGKAIEAQTCDAPTVDQVSACQPKPGTRANGAACGNDWQCQSTYCKKSGSQACGTCAIRAKVGEICDGGCEFGLTCAQTSLTERRCVVPGGAGASCLTAMVCQSPLVCESGVCTQPTYLTAGMACDPTRSKCDARQGLYCNSTTRVCAQAKYAKAGEMCGTQADGTLTVCTGGSTCPSFGTGKVCVAPAMDGAACNPSMNVGCINPASCSSGVCKLPDTAACN